MELRHLLNSFCVRIKYSLWYFFACVLCCDFASLSKIWSTASANRVQSSVKPESVLTDKMFMFPHRADGSLQLRALGEGAVTMYLQLLAQTVRLAAGEETKLSMVESSIASR